MPDEIKSPAPPPSEGEPKPTAEQPATPGGVKATSPDRFNQKQKLLLKSPSLLLLPELPLVHQTLSLPHLQPLLPSLLLHLQNPLLLCLCHGIRQ